MTRRAGAPGSGDATEEVAAPSPPELSGFRRSCEGAAPMIREGRAADSSARDSAAR